MHTVTAADFFAQSRMQMKSAQLNAHTQKVELTAECIKSQTKARPSVFQPYNGRDWRLVDAHTFCNPHGQCPLGCVCADAGHLSGVDTVAINA